MRLRDATLGIAFGELARGIHEESPNWGPRVRDYLRATDIDIPAPWCAAFVNFCAETAAQLLDDVRSPLEFVTREALVMDYVTYGSDRDWIISPFRAKPGDLVAFSFRGSAGWNHMGIVMDAPLYLERGDGTKEYGRVTTIEGNTSPGIGATDEEREREGEGVYRKRRRVVSGKALFLRWDGGRSG